MRKTILWWTPTAVSQKANTAKRSGRSFGRVRHKARDWRLKLAFALGLCFLPLTLGAAELTSLSVSPTNPTVDVGAIQSFSAIGTFNDNTVINNVRGQTK